jgi:hypothetical protein
LNQPEQPLARQLHHRAVLAHAGAHQSPPAEQHVDFAGELPGSVHGDHCLEGCTRADHLELPCRHDEKRHDRIAGVNENFALRDPPFPSVPGDSRDLCRRQRREHQRRV